MAVHIHSVQNMHDDIRSAQNPVHHEMSMPAWERPGAMGLYCQARAQTPCMHVWRLLTGVVYMQSYQQRAMLLAGQEHDEAG